MSQAERYNVIKNLMQIKSRRVNKEDSEKSELEKLLSRTFTLMKHDDLMEDSLEFLWTLSDKNGTMLMGDVLYNMAKAIKENDDGKFAPTEKLQRAMMSMSMDSPSASRNPIAEEESDDDTMDSRAPRTSRRAGSAQPSSASLPVRDLGTDRARPSESPRQNQSTVRPAPSESPRQSHSQVRPAPSSSLSLSMMNSQKVEILTNALVDFESESGIRLSEKDVTKSKVFDLRKAEIVPLAAFFADRFPNFSGHIIKTGKEGQATVDDLKKGFKAFRKAYLAN